MSKVLLMVFALVVLSSCTQNQDTKNKPQEPVIELNAGVGVVTGSGDFGNLTSPETKLITFKITNNGDATLVGPPTIDSSAFSIAYVNNCDNILPKKFCQLKVNFDSKGKPSGLNSAILHLDSAVINLTANVLTSSTTTSVTFSTGASLDFGTITDKQSVLKTIVITNTGTSTINEPIVLGTNFSNSYDTCSNKALAPTKTCQLKILLSGIGKSGNITDTLQFGGQTLSLTGVVLSSLGTTPSGSPVLTYSISSVPKTIHDMGLFSGNKNVQAVISLTNSGINASTVETAMLSGSTGFSIAYNQCSNISLAKNASCQIRVVFSSAGLAAGNYSTQLSFGTAQLTLNALVESATTYQPVYSAYGSCSATQACDGQGTKSRTMISCTKLISGVPSGNGQLSDCQPIDLSVACPSPQGEKTVSIDHGTKIVSCAQGSSTQVFVSATCTELNYSVVGEICSLGSYNLVVNKSGNGLVVDGENILCGSNCSSNYAAGTSVVLSASAEEGQEFLNWSGDCSNFGSANVCSLIMDSAKSVTANFQPKSFTLSVTLVSPNGSGPYGSVSSYNTVNNYNDPLSLTVTPENGYKFIKWVGGPCDQSTNLTCQGLITDNYDIQALFDLDCTVTQHLENNQCVDNEQTCSVDHGTGLKQWESVSYGSCIVNNCTDNYTISSDQLSCNAPVASGFVINNDNSYTNQSQVSLQISMSGTEMAIFNNSTCSGTPDWQPFANSAVRNLYALNSVNKLSIKTRTGSVESECATKSIIHDDIAPSITTSLSGQVSVDNPLSAASLVYSTNLTITDANLTGLVNYQSFDSASCQAGTEINSFSASGNALDVTVLVGQTVSVQAQLVDKAGNENVICLPFYLALQTGVAGGTIVSFDINQNSDDRCLIQYGVNNEVRDLTYLFPDAASCNQSHQFARIDSVTQTLSSTGDICSFSDNSLLVPSFYSYEQRYLVPDQMHGFSLSSFTYYYQDEDLNYQTEVRCEGPANIFYQTRTSTQDSWQSEDFSSQLYFAGKAVPTTNSSIKYPMYLKRTGSLLTVGNKIYFSAYTPEMGNELYVYDISSRQVALVKDIMPGETSTHPMLMTTDGTSLYFVASDYRIYKTQGTEASTIEVSNGPTNIRITSDDMQTSEMIVIGSKLYYTANSGIGIFCIGGSPTCVVSLDTTTHVESVLGNQPNDMYGYYTAKNMTHFNGRLYFWKKNSSATKIYYITLSNSVITTVLDITSSLSNHRHYSIYSSASKAEAEKVFIYKNTIDNELYYPNGTGVTRVTSSLTTDTTNYNRFLFYEGCTADSSQTYIYCFTNGLGVIRYPKGGTTGGATTVIATPANQVRSIPPLVFGEYIYYGSSKLHVPSGKSNEAFITSSFSPTKYFTAMDSSFNTQVYALGKMGTESAIYKASTWNKNPSTSYSFKYGSNTYETLPLNFPLPNSLTLTITELVLTPGTFTASIENDDYGAFTLSSNNCTNKNLALNATCTVTVSVNPNVTTEGLIHATLVFGDAKLEMYKVVTYSPLFKKVGETPTTDADGYSRSTGDGLFYRSFVPQVGSEVFFLYSLINLDNDRAGVNKY